MSLKTSNYSKLEKSILCVAKDDYKYFFNKKNVVAIGLGYKIKNGFYTKEKCIKIHVAKKLPKYFLSSKDIIQSTYKGIKTDIESSGYIYMNSLSSKIRPVIGGYSVSDNISKGNGGSVGCLVRDSKNYLYILSNNHVLADRNSAPLNTLILQPSISDGGTLYTSFIGNLSKFVPLKFENWLYSPTNYVDCAIAKASHPSMVSSKIAFIGNPKGINNNVALEEEVQKSGRTTEYTTGKVIELGVTAKVQTPKGTILFKDQIATSKMTDRGDSGSVLLNTKKEIVGLHAFGCDNQSIFNPINRVLSALDVTIVINHN